MTTSSLTNKYENEDEETKGQRIGEGVLKKDLQTNQRKIDALKKWHENLNRKALQAEIPFSFDLNKFQIKNEGEGDINKTLKKSSKDFKRSSSSQHKKIKNAESWVQNKKYEYELEKKSAPILVPLRKNLRKSENEKYKEKRIAIKETEKKVKEILKKGLKHQKVLNSNETSLIKQNIQNKKNKIENLKQEILIEHSAEEKDYLEKQMAKEEESLQILLEKFKKIQKIEDSSSNNEKKTTSTGNEEPSPKKKRTKRSSSLKVFDLPNKL